MKKKYFNCDIEVWKIENHPYPWRFSVIFNNKKHYYGGLPNYCATKHSAFMRAYYRAKWFSDGTINNRYKVLN